AYVTTRPGFEARPTRPEFAAAVATDSPVRADAPLGEEALRTPILRRPRSLVAFAVAAFALMAVVLLTGCTAEVDAEMQTYAGINAIRTGAGLPPLQPDAALVRAARERSNDMAKTGHFAHDRIGGCTAEFICVLDRQGVPYAYAGENIAWNNFPWESSAAH